MKKIIVSLALTLAVAFTATADSAKKKAPLKVGAKAPPFQIKDPNGKHPCKPWNDKRGCGTGKAKESQKSCPRTAIHGRDLLLELKNVIL